MRLVANERGGLFASVPIHAYRVLMDDGTTLDVEAIEDGSRMRGAVLAHYNKPDVAIAGVAKLGCVGWTTPT